MALNCALRELDDILLLDIVKGLPQGEALDINNQLSERGIDCKVSGSNNYEDMKGSDFVVVVAGVGRKPGMTRMDLLKTNADIIKDVSGKVKSYGSRCNIDYGNKSLGSTHLSSLEGYRSCKNQSYGDGWNVRLV